MRSAARRSKSPAAAAAALLSRGLGSCDGGDVSQARHPIDSSPPRNDSPATRAVSALVVMGEGSQARDVRTLCETLRGWTRDELSMGCLSEFVRLPDSAKAVVLGSLLAVRSLTELELRGCGVGEQAALAIAQLLPSPGAGGLRPSIFARIRSASAAWSPSPPVSTAEPRSPTSRSASSARPSRRRRSRRSPRATLRCTSLASLEVGAVERAAGGPGGPAARLQFNALRNHERACFGAGAVRRGSLVRRESLSRATAALAAAAASPPPSPPPSPPAAASWFGGDAPLYRDSGGGGRRAVRVVGRRHLGRRGRAPRAAAAAIA